MPNLDGRAAHRVLRCVVGLALAGAGIKHGAGAELSAFQQAQQLLLSGGLANAAPVTQLLRTAADQHDALAEYDLAYCYEHGIGVAADPAQALALYRRAAADADSDDLRAIAAIGANNLRHHLPVATPATPEVVAALVTYGAAMLRNGNVPAARLLFERAAGAGSSAAAIAMGKTYDPRILPEIGAAGTMPDPAAAADWYHRAAALGDAEGDHLLGGLGVLAAQASGSDTKRVQ